MFNVLHSTQIIYPKKWTDVASNNPIKANKVNKSDPFKLLDFFSLSLDTFLNPQIADNDQVAGVATINPTKEIDAITKKAKA